MINKSYLIILPNWVGDIVMAQTLFIYLKKKYPDCIIDIVGNSSCIALAKFMPEIRNSFLTEFKKGEFSFFKRLKIGKTFKDKGYTDVITLQNSWKSSLIPFFSTIPNRIGWKGEERWFLLNDIRKLDKKQYPLMIERFCALAENKNDILQKIDNPKFKIKQSDLNEVKKKYANEFSKSENKKIVAICPGAEFGIAKKWPSNHYADLCLDLIKKGYQIWLFGSQGDKFNSDKITENIDVIKYIDFTGKTSLREAVLLLSMVDLVVSNDSGLMHISNALNIPTVVIYGSTSDKHTPPLNDKSISVFLEEMDCRPCFKRICPLEHTNCLINLLPNRVIKAIELLLK